jgi:hypothetical protein
MYIFNIYIREILVDTALSDTTLHETCATAAQKDTALKLRSKGQCDEVAFPVLH